MDHQIPPTTSIHKREISLDIMQKSDHLKYFTSVFSQSIVGFYIYTYVMYLV